MSISSLDGYREAAAQLSPPTVAQYLASQQWQLEADDGIKEIWHLPGEGGLPEARIMLPVATDYADFADRFRDTLYALGRIFDWDAAELHEQIMATRADLFFVRLDQAFTDGTIAFRQAERTLEALYKMFKAAATTAAAPHHSHRGRRPARVTDFLEEDVRLGHTKRGSFVFTVVTRLGEPPDTESTTVHTPFPRKVTETLARGLETTKTLTRRWNARALEDPGEHGLSAGLLEALEDITKPPSLRLLDLSFAWAPTEPRPDVGMEAIVLDRDAIGALARVRECLVRQEEPPRRETLVGLVKSLTREDTGSDGDELGTVILTADVNGRERRVHITLSEEDHNWAIVAYRNKLPFTATGDLIFERGAWRLVGDVEVDSSFLRHRTE